MGYLKINELIKQTGNRYVLSMLVAKRTKQIVDGYPPLLDTFKDIPIYMADEEVLGGYISYKEQEDKPIEIDV
jgi:DNA-directed RNA polymerase subunit omega